jgi:hypothetical protein
MPTYNLGAYTSVTITRPGAGTIYTATNLQIDPRDPLMASGAADAFSMPVFLFDAYTQFAKQDIRIGDTVTDPATLNPATAAANAWIVVWDVGRYVNHTELLLVTFPYQQSVLYYQRITPQTAGATPTAAWDALRRGVISEGDGSFGVGWQVGARLGYLAPLTLIAGLNDAQQGQQQTDAGMTTYQAPLLLYAPPTVMSKGDVIVRMSDGKRFVVGDTQTPLEAFSIPIATIATLEGRQANDVIYTIV